MTGNETELAGNGIADQASDCIMMDSQLSELIRISPWIDKLASQHSIPENVTFAMNLCLEETLSNSIRHGYRGHNGPLTVRFTSPDEGCFVLIVEDEAPRFDPLEQEPPPAYSADDPTQIGGQGIRLIRGFSDSLEYSATATGNQLRIGFKSQASPK
jgi:serine/threonine-protein kinase RsbW